MILTINQRVISLLLALLLGVFGVVMMPKAAQANYPPAPTVFDRCGTVQDETYIPLVEGVSYSRDGVGLTEDFYHPTGGASVVTIVADYIVYDADGWGYHEYQPFTLNYDVSSPGGCVEAANAGSVIVGTCNPSTGGTQITVNYTNTADSSGYSENVVNFSGQGSGGNVVHALISGTPVADGQTVSWTGGQSVDIPFYPGDYRGTFTGSYLGDVLLDNVIFTVPACGDREFPENGGDTSDGGSGSGGGTTGQATAKLKLVKCRTGRVKAIMNNRRVNSVSRFRVVADPASGKTLTKIYKVKSRKVMKVYRTGANRVYKVHVRNVAKKRWVKLAKLRAPTTSKCTG